MGVLPQLSGKQLIRLLELHGYQVIRQRGSHVVLRRTFKPHRRIVVPLHRAIAKGTLRAIIRQSGMTVDEFFDV